MDTQGSLGEMLDAVTQTMADTVWSLPLFFLLLGCGLLFSIITKFVQWRILTHGYSCIRGHYDRPEDTGHINHFQALCAALSATIGLGNIAGVAVAVSLGGPGAVFWMWLVGLFGMTLKFMECSLAVMYRSVRALPGANQADHRDFNDPAAPNEHQEVRGGPMWYIQKALVEPLRKRGQALWFVFKVLAVLYSIGTILNSFGSGNTFQGWNVADVLQKNFHVSVYISASIVSVLVALVIIGGIRRIGNVASKLVPFMCVAYVLGALYVVIVNASEIPACLALIMKSAFTPIAQGGAFAGASVWVAFSWGLKRACFSNEAGEGSAAMAHAAARTEEPIREGVVAGIGPFVDTIIICTMSALVLLISGAWNRPAVGAITALNDNTATLTVSKDIPPKIKELYLDRFRNPEQTKARLAIYTSTGPDQDFQSVKVDIPKESAKQLADENSRWRDLAALNLDISRLSDADRAALAVGQDVHLDIDGAELTRLAFDLTLKGFGAWIVTLGVCLFAFSTMISWSYYGENAADYLLGPKAVLPYKIAFVFVVFLGMILPDFNWIYNFSDAAVGMMVLCNLPAVLILSPRLVRAHRDYIRRLDSGQMPRLR